MAELYLAGNGQYLRENVYNENKLDIHSSHHVWSRPMDTYNVTYMEPASIIYYQKLMSFCYYTCTSLCYLAAVERSTIGHSGSSFTVYMYLVGTLSGNLDPLVQVV